MHMKRYRVAFQGVIESVPRVDIDMLPSTPQRSSTQALTQLTHVD